MEVGNFQGVVILSWRMFKFTPYTMDNLRNLFGQVSTLASSKTNSTVPANGTSTSAGSHNPGLNPGERQRSISGDFSSMDTHQNRTMKQYKTADRDSYYYIMWRS
ncbi:uncharacterized protein LOC5574677 isoform X1 [Aedes aegypti]|uniref:Uncharacterized protein n=2 Tax=Aedes aegypti TaxID=7159 RepID=A0A6R8GM31_AEDAE|nr:uncharacterized protein LOC5574677 isoform X1 [Aedes aegypti]